MMVRSILSVLLLLSTLPSFLLAWRPLLPSRASQLRALPEDILHDMKLNVVETARYRGYPAEAHNVTTSDGYILQMHRIPHGRSGPGAGKKPAVLIQHGLFDTSFSWVSHFPHQSLGFLFADAGFDVWLGNVRGNVYSRRHTSLDPNTDTSFWEFSFDQYARFDMPSMLDYIIATTGNEKVFYVGHSQGTTMAFASLSRYPETNAKVKYFAALAPVTRLGHTTDYWFQTLAPYAHLLLPLVDMIGTGEFVPHGPVLGQIALDECDRVRQKIGKMEITCGELINGIISYNERNINQSRVPVLAAHLPGGTSTQGVLHFAQSIALGTFSMFDFGTLTNYEVYGQAIPPAYEPRNIRVPVALFWSLQDDTAPPEDYAWLTGELRKANGLVAGGVLRHEQRNDEYHHRDYIWGIHANREIYAKVIELFKAEI